MKNLSLYLILFFFSQNISSQNWRMKKFEDLEIKTQPQTKEQWCWAAVSASIINYYEDTNFKDCNIASSAFNINCCTNSSVCNQQNSISFIGNVIERNSFASSKVMPGIVSKKRLIREIDEGDPLILRVESHFGGHFIVVSGYIIYEDTITGNQMMKVMIKDPMWGYFHINNDGTSTLAKFIEFSELISGKGPDYNLRWTHTIEFE